MEKTVMFLRNISIGLLEISTSKFSRLENVGKEHAIFEKIKPPFDWYFYDNILVIPDPVPIAREKWYKKVGINDFGIECRGSFLVFFNFIEVNDGIVLADSLTLPQFEFLKRSIRWVWCID